MKKESLRICLILGVLAILAVSPALAQTSSSQTANIPFEFSVGDKTFPAGRYSITRLNPQSDKTALLIRDEEGRTSKVVLTTPMEARRAQEMSKLVFSRYDNHYFLAEVWTQAANTGLELPKSRSERSLARHAGEQRSERVAIALNTRQR